MRPPIPARLGVDLTGGPPEVRMAGQILIGIELEAMKQAMGYEPGSWQQHRGEDGRSTRPLWTEFCRTGAGISDVTAGKLVRMAIAVQRRLEARPEMMRFASLMDKPPSTLPAATLEELRGVIAREVKGTTRKALAAESCPERVSQAFPSIPRRVIRKAMKALRRRMETETR